MKILVTGATGFLGRAVIPCLLARGHAVIATSRDDAAAASMPWFSSVDYRPFDIGGAEAASMERFDSPDLLLHLAWSRLDDFRSPEHTDSILQNHIRFLTGLLQSGLKQCVVTGTCLEYGRQSGQLIESMDAQPQLPYALAKHRLREALVGLQASLDFTLRWIRLFYLHGPGQSPRALLPQLDAAIDGGQDAFPMSGGQQLRDYLSIEDAAERVCGIAEHCSFEGIVNCCSGKPISVQELAENHLHKRGATMRLELGAYPYPDYEAMEFWGDTTCLDRLLGGDS